MVDAGIVEAAAITAVVAAGTTAYTVNQQRSAAEKAANRADEMAARARADTNQIALPNTSATAANMQAAQQQAASAGGTVFGSASGGNVGDNANTPRKSLLGS
jgi:hypothetical protein